MPRSNVIQTDFLAGEISPRLEMQENLEGRNHGVEFMENWDILLQGSVETSPGTEYVCDVAARGRLIGFPVSPFSGFMALLTGDTITVYDAAGPVEHNNKIANAYFVAGNSAWSVSTAGTGSVDILHGRARLRHGGGDASSWARMWQSQLVTAGRAYRVKIVIPEAAGRYTVELGTADGWSNIDVFSYEGSQVIEIENVVSSSSTLSVKISAAFTDSEILVTGVYMFDTTVAISYVSYFSPWEEEDVELIQAALDPSSPSILADSGKMLMVIVTRGALPQVLQYNAIDDSWSFFALPITSQPFNWVSDSYPTAVGFFGGRMWVGGAVLAPSTFWASKVGDIGNFTLGSLDDDAIEASINQGGMIQWISGGLGLVMGTDSSEHVISSVGGVITPGDINATLQSTNGSWPAQAVEVGNQLMYISADGRKIRSIEYEWAKDAWRSKDITYASEHLTGGGNSLKHLAYSANPNSRMIGATQAHEIVQATYEPYSQTVGFSRRVTQGVILSAAVLSAGGAGELWMLVDREEDGSTFRLEKVPYARNIKLDSHSKFLAATNPAGGLYPINSGVALQLAGKTCQVLVDGAYHPDVIPDGSGNFTTEWSGDEILIGLKIASTIHTLPIEGAVANVGTTRPMRKRLIEIGLKILNSFRPKVNGRRVSDASGETAVTEVLKVTDTGWGDEARLIIEQDLPLRTELAGWFGKIDREDT